MLKIKPKILIFLATKMRIYGMKIYFYLMMSFVKPAVFIFFIVLVPIKCSQLVAEKSIYRITKDKEERILSGVCMLNVLYYIDNYNVELVKDINNNVIYCETIRATYDERKNMQWR